MGRFYVPANSTFDGPWLLSQSSLEKLNHVVDEIYQKLGQALESKIKQESEDDQSIEVSKKLTKLRRKYSPDGCGWK